MLINKETIAIIDADFLLYTATMGNKVLDEQGNPVRQDNKFVYTWHFNISSCCNFFPSFIHSKNPCEKYNFKESKNY